MAGQKVQGELRTHRTHRTHRTGNGLIYLTMLPLCVLYGVLILGGLYRILCQSLGYVPKLGMLSFQVDAYTSLSFEPLLLLKTLLLPMTSALISGVLGTLLAYGLLCQGNALGSKIMRGLLTVGLIMPYIYMAFVVQMWLGRTGLISRGLFTLGWLNDFDAFPQLLYGGGFGVILVFVLKGVPFVTLFMYNLMCEINVEYKWVSMTMGGTTLQNLKYIYLPLCASSLTWCMMILCIYGIGSYEIPYLFAERTLSVSIFSAFIDPHIESRLSAMALCIVTLCFSIACAVVLKIGVKQGVKWLEKH